MDGKEKGYQAGVPFHVATETLAEISWEMCGGLPYQPVEPPLWSTPAFLLAWGCTLKKGPESTEENKNRMTNLLAVEKLGRW